MNNKLSTQRITVMLVVIWLAYMLSFFHRFAPSGIVPQLTSSFHAPATSLGILAGGYFYVYTLMQIPTGVILDTLGPRLLLLWGGVIAGIGSIGFGLAPSLEWAIVARLVVGMGVSVTFLAMLKVYALIFPVHRFSTMVGIGMFIGNMGSMLAGYPLSAMASIMDWRILFFGLGLLSLMLGLASARAIPELIVSPSLPQTSFFDKMSKAWQGLWLVIRNRLSWPPALVNGGVAGCLFGFGGLWISPWLRDVQGITAPMSGWIISLFFLGFALGSLSLGRWSDISRHRTIPMKFASLLHFILFIFLLWGMKTSLAMNMIVLFLLGFSSSAFTLTWTSIKEINPPSLSGTSTSFANMAGFLMGGILQVVVGKVIDRQADIYAWWGSNINLSHPSEAYRLPIGIFVLCAGVAFASTFFVKETYARQIQK